jgi:hypothetical protein
MDGGLVHQSEGRVTQAVIAAASFGLARPAKRWLYPAGGHDFK